MRRSPSRRDAATSGMALLALAVLLLFCTAAPTALADGPSDPEFDPAVIAKQPASNIHVAGPYDDWLSGDRLPGQTAYFFGKAGDDLLDTQLTNDIIFGGPGNDGLYGEDGNDTLIGGPGNDTLIGGPGRDFLYGDDGDDYMDGDPCGKGNTCVGPGVVYDDWMHGGSGRDKMIGRQGRDEMYGGPGDDTISGNLDDDYVDGQDGNDGVFGNEGDDYLVGGNGNDTLFAGPGTDILYGGPGFDILHGGSGSATKNIFVVDAKCGETDDIRYFTPSQGDKVIVVGSLNGQVLTVKEQSHVVGIYLGNCTRPIATFAGHNNTVAAVQAALSTQASAPPKPSWVLGPNVPEPTPGVNGVPSIPPDGVLQGTALGDNLTAPQTTAGAFMWGLNLNDLMTGGPGPDCMIGGGHNDTMFGGDGDDRMSGSSGYDVIFGQGGRDALFGGHNKDILYGGGWGNWYTGGDSVDQIYVDAPASCQATGAAPDILNDFDGDLIYIVGTYTSVSQLSVAKTGADTTISIPGCSKPFFLARNATVPPANIKFIAPGKVPKTPLGQ